MEYLKQFQKHIFDNQLAPLVSLWQEYSFCDEVDPNELKAILNSLSQSPFAVSFGKYAEDILTLWEKIPEGEEKRTVRRTVIFHILQSIPYFALQLDRPAHFAQ